MIFLNKILYTLPFRPPKLRCTQRLEKLGDERRKERRGGQLLPKNTPDGARRAEGAVYQNCHPFNGSTAISLPQKKYTFGIYCK